MILINNNRIDITAFPDGTSLIRQNVTDLAKNSPKIDGKATAEITWRFDSEAELIQLIYLVEHIRNYIDDIYLVMPYIPNARMDRVKSTEEVFTLKHFAKIINSLGFKHVKVLDAHSYVSEALIDNCDSRNPVNFVMHTLQLISKENKDIILFFPDEGAMKRYSSSISAACDIPYAFGIKNRNWQTGEIKSLDIAGQIDDIKGKTILIVDDICSRGGTFYHSAKRLKELGAGNIYLYVSHCENAIFDGELIKSDELIKHIYTTNSIYRGTSDKITAYNVNDFIW